MEVNELAFRERGRGRGEEATFPGENSSPGLTEKKFKKQTQTCIYKDATTFIWPLLSTCLVV